MTIRNRELSQFASFTSVDDTNKNIGLSTQIDEFVGIGTTAPITKFHVYGDTYVDGDFTVTGKADVGNLDIDTTGIITAFTYYSTKFGLTELVNPVQDRWQGIGDDIYRLDGNVGIGISAISDRLHVIGNVRGTQFISTISTGTAPFIVNSITQVQNLNADRVRGGIPGNNNSGDIITTDASQTLTNKTLTSASLSNPIITGTISFNGVTVTSPTNSGVIITSNDTGTVTSAMIANNTIVNADINTNAAISYSKLNLSNSITNNDIATNANIDVQKLSGATISGVVLGNNLFSLTINSNYLTGTSYNGSVGVALSVKASSQSVNGNIVARDSQGNFSANTIDLTQNLNVNSGTISARQVTVGVNGLTIQSNGNLTVNSGGYIIGQVPTLHLQDQKASGTNGGTFTAGSWIRRTLNTVVTNTITGSSLSSDQITLTAGTYEIIAHLPAYSSNSHQSRFVSSTAGIAIYGTTEYANARDTGGEKSESMSRSMINGRFTINSTINDFQLEHRCSDTRTTDGFGLACNFGNIEVYSDIIIKKIG